MCLKLFTVITTYTNGFGMSIYSGHVTGHVIKGNGYKVINLITVLSRMI